MRVLGVESIGHELVEHNSSEPLVAAAASSSVNLSPSRPRTSQENHTHLCRPTRATSSVAAQFYWRVFRRTFRPPAPGRS
jgi:hypothetical protein